MYIIYTMDSDNDVRLIGYSSDYNIKKSFEQCLELSEELNQIRKSNPDRKTELTEIYKNLRLYNQLETGCQILIDSNVDAEFNKTQLKLFNNKVQTIKEEIESIKINSKESFEKMIQNCYEKYSKNVRKFYNEYKYNFETCSIFIDECKELNF